MRFANGARALARVFALPGDDLDDVSALCRDAADGGDDALATRLRAIADRLDASDREAYARSYAELFLGPFSVPVPPYASWFLDPERTMMGPVAQAAADAYAAAGVGPADGPRELPDHVSVELEFCYLLGYRAIEDGDPEAAGLLDAFWRRQVATWLPTFAASVEEHADHAALEAAARALRALVTHGPAVAAGPVTEGVHA